MAGGEGGGCWVWKGFSIQLILTVLMPNQNTCSLFRLQPTRHLLKPRMDIQVDSQRPLVFLFGTNKTLTGMVIYSAPPVPPYNSSVKWQYQVAVTMLCFMCSWPREKISPHFYPLVRPAIVPHMNEDNGVCLGCRKKVCGRFCSVGVLHVGICFPFLWPPQETLCPFIHHRENNKLGIFQGTVPGSTNVCALCNDK